MNWVLVLVMDSTGQLVLAGEKVWFLLSGDRKRQEGNDPGRLGERGDVAAAICSGQRDRDHVSRERFGRGGTLRGYGPAVVSGMGAGMPKALVPGDPKGRTCLVSSSSCTSLVHAALPQS